MKRGNNMKKFGKLGLGAAVVSLFALLVGKKLNDQVGKKDAEDRGVSKIGSLSNRVDRSQL